MSKTKKKLLLVGLGLMGLNLCAFALLMLWPQKTHEGDTSVSTVRDAEGVVATETQERASLSVSSASQGTSQPPVKPQKASNEAVAHNMYVIPIVRDTSVLDAMYAFEESSGGGFTFSGKEYAGMGFFVEAINGKASEDDTYWILYINGKSSSVGASQAKVHRGDVVEWKYEKSIY